MYLQEDVLDKLEAIVGPEKRTNEAREFESLVKQLGLDGDELANKELPRKDLVGILMAQTKLTESQVDAIVAHLETYERVMIDNKFLAQQIREAKNESIFFGKKSEIRDFCLGRLQVTVADKVIELKDNQACDRQFVVQALRSIVKMPDAISDAQDKSRFQALLIQLGFDAGQKLEAVTSFNRYSFRDPTNMERIQTFLEVINLKDCSTDLASSIERLDLSVCPRLDKNSAHVLATLKANLGADKPLKKDDFGIKDDEDFMILRAILDDANIIKSSLFNLLTNQTSSGVNQELEAILMRFFYSGGSISDTSVVLKEARQGSEELFARLLELRVIKPPKVNFEFAKGTYVPQFVGGNFWKEDNDPAKQIELIKKKVEKVSHILIYLTFLDCKKFCVFEIL